MNIKTTTGAGCAIVDVIYDFDSEGDIDEFKVLLDGMDVTAVLSEDQRGELEGECLQARADDYKTIGAEDAYYRSEALYHDWIEA